LYLRLLKHLKYLKNPNFHLFLRLLVLQLPLELLEVQ
jgi:hypothetical protein